MTETIIIIPCYNEAERLDVETFRAFVKTQPALAFLFVDDGSTDATGQVIQSLRDADPDTFSVLTLERNSGKGEAVRQGMLRAYDMKPEFYGFWDADLSTPLELIPSFLEALRDDAERVAVIGSRVRSLGRHIERRMMRHYMGRVFATFAALVLGVGVYDTQCGAKVFRATDATRDLFLEPFVAKWVFDVELLARLLKKQSEINLSGLDGAVLELPLDQWKDVEGSKLRLRDAARAFIDLLRIRSRYPISRNQG